jgi:hypothetical protein
MRDASRILHTVLPENLKTSARNGVDTLINVDAVGGCPLGREALDLGGPGSSVWLERTSERAAASHPTPRCSKALPHGNTEAC